MSQRVIISIGDPVVSGSIQEILKSISDPGIFRGFNFNTPSGNTLSISPGSALTDSGVLIVETEERNLTFNLTVAPANFTVYYSYITTKNFGGNPAVLTVQPGLINPENFTNGVILGWVKYPGGSIPLNTSMFISGPRFRLSKPTNFRSDEYDTQYAPLSNKWTQYSVTGPSPSISEYWDVDYKSPITKISNPGTLLSRSKYVLPFRVPYSGVGKVQIELQSDSGSNATINILDKKGNIITPPEMNFFTNFEMERHTLTVPSSPDLTPNSEAFILLSFDIQPTFSVRLKSVGISSYVEPF